MTLQTWLSSLAIAVLAGLTANAPLLPLVVLLLAILLCRFHASWLATLLSLTAGTTISYTLSAQIESVTFLERLSVFAPAALSVAALVYASSILSNRLSDRFSTWKGGSCLSVLAFPLFWAGGWMLFCRAHPLGRLLTWTPISSLQGFSPLLPVFGLVGYDFVVACMAVVACEVLGGIAVPSYSEPLLVNFRDDEEYQDERIRSLHTGSSSITFQRTKSIRALGLVLFLFWTISTVVQRNIHEPVAAIEEIVRLACVLPQDDAQDWSSSLADYMSETEIVSGRGAKVLVWPEAATHLSTAGECRSFSESLLSLASRRKAFIAPSFIANPVCIDNTQQKQKDAKEMVQTALVGSENEVVYTYAKQALVPIAESHRYKRGSESLPHDKQIFVPRPNQRGKARPSGAEISISSAICHDTSFPSILQQAHPASLTLVPSSVFSEPIAWTRIHQLQASAVALGSAYLVCDGASTGISAFIDQKGQLRYWQKGGGSWEISASLTQGKSTPYGRYGEFGALAILLAICLGMAILEALWKTGRARFQEMWADMRHSASDRVKGLIGWVDHHSIRPQPEAAESLI